MSQSPRPLFSYQPESSTENNDGARSMNLVSDNHGVRLNLVHEPWSLSNRFRPQTQMSTSNASHRHGIEAENHRKQVHGLNHDTEVEARNHYSGVPIHDKELPQRASSIAGTMPIVHSAPQYSSAPSRTLYRAPSQYVSIFGEGDKRPHVRHGIRELQHSFADTSLETSDSASDNEITGVPWDNHGFLSKN